VFAAAHPRFPRAGSHPTWPRNRDTKGASTTRWTPSMDPVTFSIIRHRLFRVTDEAVITLKHVSGSATTNEGHDLLVGLYRADGSLLMGGLGFLNHMVYAAQACKVIISRFAGNIHEHDIFLLMIHIPPRPTLRMFIWSRQFTLKASWWHGALVSYTSPMSAL
jgi:hypothetical protein